MRTIIAGGRGVTDYRQVFAAMLACPFAVSEVVSGCAAGVEAMGEQWAEEHGIPVRRFPADEASERMVNVQRRQMVAYADALVAVRGGEDIDGLLAEASRVGLKVFVHQVDRLPCGSELNHVRLNS